MCIDCIGLITNDCLTQFYFYDIIMYLSLSSLTVIFSEYLFLLCYANVIHSNQFVHKGLLTNSNYRSSVRTINFPSRNETF